MRRSSENGLARAIDELRQLLGVRCSTLASDRETHGGGEAYHPNRPPDAVCYPLSTEEAAEAVRICVGQGVPIVPFGAGTSLEGHVCALEGGVSIDMSRMNAILDVHAADLDAAVQAGVTRLQLDEYLRDSGLFFPVDPGADATIGGMVATRASGTNAVRYGTMRENVLWLTVVLPDGRVMRTAQRARKSSAGYDLTRLFVGSEGTLGLITEVGLKLHGRPEAVSAARCSFPSAEAAVAAAVQLIQSGVPVARVEFMDENAIAAVNAHAGTSFPRAATLLYEFHGSPESVEADASNAGELAEENGGTGFVWVASEDERARLWHVRHNFHYAMLAQRPGAKIWGTDVCAPISNLPDCVAKAVADVRSAPFPAAAIGHVGDGNFHMSYLIDVESPDELAQVRELNRRMVLHAIECGGTCTGEHGVGYGKSKFLPIEFDAVALDVMHMIKERLDPRGLFNPGKVLPE